MSEVETPVEAQPEAAEAEDDAAKDQSAYAMEPVDVQVVGAEEPQAGTPPEAIEPSPEEPSPEKPEAAEAEEASDEPDAWSQLPLRGDSDQELIQEFREKHGDKYSHPLEALSDVAYLRRVVGYQGHELGPMRTRLAELEARLQAQPDPVSDVPTVMKYKASIEKAALDGDARFRDLSVSDRMKWAEHYASEELKAQREKTEATTPEDQAMVERRKSELVLALTVTALNEGASGMNIYDSAVAQQIGQIGAEMGGDDAFWGADGALQMEAVTKTVRAWRDRHGGEGNGKADQELKQRKNTAPVKRLRGAAGASNLTVANAGDLPAALVDSVPVEADLAKDWRDNEDVYMAEVYEGLSREKAFAKHVRDNRNLLKKGTG